MLSKQQFGFKKNMPTTQIIGGVYERIIKNIDCSQYTCCVFLNLTKAFNTVNHAILLYNMEYNFGVRELPLQIFKITN